MRVDHWKARKKFDKIMQKDIKRGSSFWLLSGTFYLRLAGYVYVLLKFERSVNAACKLISVT